MALLLPQLVQNGMFVDGVTYGAISNNLANGLGSIWKPHYTQTLYPEFYEHPPLFFIIQSVFFKVLGSGIFTERIFTFLTAILSALGIILCWKLFTKENGLKKYSWIPVLLWISIPIISWSFRNNMIENLLSVLSVFSVYFILKSLLNKDIAYLFLGAVFILMSFLAKGPVGLFPIIIPSIFTLLFYNENKIGQGFLYQIYLIGFTLSTLFVLLWAFPELKYNLESYLEQQLLPALSNSREITTENRFSILFRLATELTVPIILCIFIFIRNRLYSKTKDENDHKVPVLFLVIAVSASLPLVLSLKQGAFYLVPSIPFYILSITFYLIPYIKKPLESITDRLKIGIVSISAFAAILVIIYSVSHIHDYSRDQKILSDINIISENIAPNTTLGTHKDLEENWTAIAYFSRIAFISLDSEHSNHQYYLKEKNSSIPLTNLEEYDPVQWGLSSFEVYQRKE